MTTALITGAAKGIGQEAAAQLVDRGTRVFLTARRLDAATEAAHELDGDVHPLALDVTDTDSIAAAVEEVRAGGGLDVLINNAAAFPDWAQTALTTSADDLDLAWRTNVVGPWQVTQAFLPLLQQSAAPRIVNVTSGSGSHGEAQFGLGAGAGMTPYAVTKAAANAMTRKLAAALPDMLVNAVDPGLTATAPGMEAMGARPVREGAASVVWAALLDENGPTGGFFRDGVPLPW
jgi:NAD(P)-dependent dehydrogenase (short-subunit alcohol dehydrogenase family)